MKLRPLYSFLLVTLTQVIYSQDLKTAVKEEFTKVLSDSIQMLKSDTLIQTNVVAIDTVANKKSESTIIKSAATITTAAAGAALINSKSEEKIKGELDTLKETEKLSRQAKEDFAAKEKLQSQQMKMQKEQLKIQEKIAETAEKNQKLAAKNMKIQEKAAKAQEKNTNKSQKVNEKINGLSDDIAKETLSLNKLKNKFEKKKLKGKLSDSKIADEEHEFVKRQLKIQELEMKLAKEQRELNHLSLKSRN